MADYIDPNSDTDLVGSALPEGQAKAPTSSVQDPAAPRKDPTNSLDILGDGGAALDKLHEQSIKDKEPKADVKSGGEGDGGDPAAGLEDIKAPDAGEADKGGPKRTPAIPEADNEPGKEDDPLEEIKPPAGTSPKTAEAWDAFKAKAREEITLAEGRAKAVADEKAKLEARVKELEEKANKALTPEQEAEISELRKWRAAKEVNTAPELVSLDTKLTANSDTLLTKLKEAGMVDKQIQDIRKIGIDKVDWDELKPHMSSQLRQFVDAKLVQHVNLSEERAATYAGLKSRGEEFLKQRQQAQEQEVQQRIQQTESAVEQFSNAKPFSFLKQVDIPADADADTKKALAADNEFAKAMRDSIDQWKKNLDDPNMRAELLFGSVMAYKIKRDYQAAQQRIAVLEKELETTNEKFERVKKAGGAGRRSGNATPAPVRPGSSFTRDDGTIKSSGEALDELAAPYMNR
jgi:hypothetical protein